MKSINTENLGVHVQASSIGSLEALLSFLKKSEIPVASVGIGSIYSKHIAKCALMKEKKPE